MPHLPNIIVLTGASGVGKSSLVNDLKLALNPEDFRFFHFDAIGVPTFEEMVEEFGSTENWQKLKTFEWMERLVQLSGEQTLIFEGSTSITFIQEGFQRQSFDSYQIVLIDCTVEEMNRRLIQDRNQPELVNEHMANWLAYLREQAKEMGVEILDTSKYSRAEMVSLFVEKVLKI